MFRQGRLCRLFNEWKVKNPRATKNQTVNWLDTIGNNYCSFILFAGVPEQRYQASRFRGFECSMLIFVEADQLSKSDLDLGMACLRWKGSDPETCDEKGFIKDSCCILDSNPPGTAHWIPKLEEESKDDRNVRFWHLRTRDNAHNLPAGYVENLERQYKKNPAMLARMVNGEYADAFDGSPVLYEFSQDNVGENLPWPKGAYLVRGWDFGTTHSVVWSAYWSDGIDEYWWDLHEYSAMQSDVDRQCKAVAEITHTLFPFWNDRLVCAGVKDYCDVAGNAKTDKGSSVQVLRTYGIYPGFQKMGLQESIAVYNRLCTNKDRFGRNIYKIDKVNCQRLYTASIGGYRYPVEGESGFGGNEPLKGPSGGNYDHICFTGETLVATEFGDRPISSIRVGDRVWTRTGLKKVSASWQTSASAEVREYTFSTGRSFWATENHPVWSCAYGWKPVSALQSGDFVISGSHPTPTQLLCTAAHFATRGNLVKTEPVYNLTVEDNHEYFAEGVLVSNCDASRYPKYNLLRLIRTGGRGSPALHRRALTERRRQPQVPALLKVSLTTAPAFCTLEVTMNLGREHSMEPATLPVSISAKKISYPGITLNDEVAKTFCAKHPCELGQEFTGKVKLRVTGLRKDEYGHSLSFDVESIDGVSTNKEEDADNESKTLGYKRPTKEVKEKPDMSSKTIED